MAGEVLNSWGEGLAKTPVFTQSAEKPILDAHFQARLKFGILAYSETHGSSGED
jgi:hypothetical protein